MENNKKLTLGRQRIEIVRIEKSNHRQVTFSKRRSGIFKKASELCTLCGVDMLVVVFSPANHAFSFGNPDVDSLVNRFFAQDGHASASSALPTAATAVDGDVSRDLNEQLDEIEALIEQEKERGKELDKQREINQKENWWQAPINTLNTDQLLQLGSAYQDLRQKLVEVHAQKMHVLAMEAKAAATAAATVAVNNGNNLFCIGESSGAATRMKFESNHELMNANFVAAVGLSNNNNNNVMSNNLGGFNFYHVQDFNDF